MHTHKDSAQLNEQSGPRPARGKEELVGIDDIGLPSGIQPDDAGTLDQLRPEPDKLQNQSS